VTTATTKKTTNNNNNNNNNNKVKAHVEAQVQSQDSPVGVCGDKMALGRRFSNRFTHPTNAPSIITPLNSPYSSVITEKSNRSILGRSLASPPSNKTYWILVKSRQYRGQQRGYAF
jgi:hypothetical protein